MGPSYDRGPGGGSTGPAFTRVPARGKKRRHESNPISRRAPELAVSAPGSAKGAVACGHPATAAAAQEILEDGGNAFDAALAAFCAAAVAEPVLCSLGGGGFLLARRAEGAALLYDFFVETPLRRRDAAAIDFYPILADFGTATQEFHIGLGAIGTPGAIRGLFDAHADLGSLPMTRLVAPAARIAREGVPLRPVDSYLFNVVGPILIARPEGRARFTRPEGALLAHPDVLRQPELADTLEALARDGPALLHEGELGQRLVADCRDQGGQITMADLAAYRTIKRQPLVRRHRGCRILTNPPPSAGGILIAFALELLARTDLGPLGFGTAAHLELLARVMGLTNKARVEARLHEGAARAAAGAAAGAATGATAGAEEQAAAGRLFDPELLARYGAEVADHPVSNRGTTHISVVDAAGNIAALSISNCEGCGYMVPGSGIMMNNMLGEEDLNPRGFHAWPEGRRMSSMMAPTVAYQPVEKGVIDRVSRHGEAYRGEGGFAILGDDEDDLNDQDGSSGRNKHEQGANSARHGLLRGAGADELAHQQR